MNENLNLCEILKDCPKGTKFYSPFYGDCEFVEVCDGYVRVRSACVSYSINANGTFHFGTFDSVEIMLFPSREQRDWSKWVCPKQKFDPKTLNPFDKVLIFNNVYMCWVCDFYSHKIEKNEYDDYKLPYVCVGDSTNRIIPYNDYTKHLVGTTEEAPEFYRYWD